MNKFKYLLMIVLLLCMSLPVMTVNAASLHQAVTDTPTVQATSTMTDIPTAENTPTATPTTTNTIPTSTTTATANASTSTSTATTTATVITTTATPTPLATDTIMPTTIKTSTPIPSATNQTPLPETRTHSVRPGETLFCIGRAYKVWPFAIAEINHIWWPYTIYPNQKLTIPTTIWSPIPAGPICPAQFSPSAPTATATLTPAPKSTPICHINYIVQRGDTLYQIAIRYGTTYPELARINQIVNPRLIYIGQQLCIP